CLDPRVKLVLRHVVRVIARVERLLARHAVDEWLFLVETRPWAIVDVEVVESLLAGGRLVGLQLLLERIVTTPDLTQEQRIEQLRRRDDLIERLPVFGRELRRVSGQCRRRKPCDLAGQIRISAVWLLSDQRGGE